MDHVVFLDKKSKELEKLLDNSKTMIIRGAAGRKLPYGRVKKSDRLYFVINDGSGLIQATGIVKTVFNSEKMAKEESIKLVSDNQSKLNLTNQQSKRWAGKRYIVLIEIENVEVTDPFKIDKTEFSTMDDWLPIGEIEKYKI